MCLKLLDQLIFSNEIFHKGKTTIMEFKNVKTSWYMYGPTWDTDKSNYILIRFAQTDITYFLYEQTRESEYSIWNQRYLFNMDCCVFRRHWTRVENRNNEIDYTSFKDMYTSSNKSCHKLVFNILGFKC